MGKSRKCKTRDLMRKIEYQRNQEKEQQTQIAIDYLKTHCKLAFDNEDYPLTEKVLTSQPAELKNLLGTDAKLHVNPDSFPEGLVIDYDFWKLNF